ncbi:MAG: outer membrane beta-barrel protein [Gallionellaceae bacterium]|jgi:hypothetical protein
MKKIIAILFLSATFAAPAVAANPPFYAGVQAGYGLGIFGGLELNKVFAVEVDYLSYSSRSNFDKCGFSNCGNYVTASSLGVYAVGKIPLSFQAISAFGKLGVVKNTVSANNGGTVYSNNDTTLGAGIGVQYDFEHSIAARLGVDVNSYYSDDIYLAVLYKF